MIGDVGLGKPRPLDDRPDSQFACPQGFEDFQTRGIAETAKEARFDVQVSDFGADEHRFLNLYI